MASATSRYASSETAVLDDVGSDGQPRQVAYLRRRFLPPLEAGPGGGPPPAPGSPTLEESGLQISAAGSTLRSHRVDARDRLDLMAWSYLGDPLLFWQIADSNACTFPDELTAIQGRRIIVPQLTGTRPGIVANPF
jgi:hypothetical protein